MLIDIKSFLVANKHEYSLAFFILNTHYQTTAMYFHMVHTQVKYISRLPLEKQLETSLILHTKNYKKLEFQEEYGVKLI